MVTTLRHVGQVLHISEAGMQDPTLLTAYDAAEEQVARLCRWDETKPPPADLVQSVVLRTARLLARRDSPTGVLGVGDFGPVRLAAVDRDVVALEAPYRPVVFG